MHSQEPMIQCKVLQGLLRSKEVLNENYEYNDLLNDTQKQKVVVKFFSKSVTVVHTIIIMLAGVLNQN